MNMEIGYNWIVNKGELADYFESRFLKYQLKNGRISVEDFAGILGFSKAYLSLLMNGRRTTLSFNKAKQVAVALEDYEIMEILGYDNDGISEDPLSKLPPGLRKTLSSVMQDCRSKGIALDSEFAESLFVEAMTEFVKQNKVTDNNSES